MKKLITLIVALILVTMNSAMAETYFNPAIVIASDNDLVTVEDYDGNIWEFCGDGDLLDLYILEFDDNGTPDDIYDDMIVDATYAGNLSIWNEMVK